MNILSCLRAEKFFRKGLSFADKGHSSEAIKMFNLSADISPSLSANYLHRGLAWAAEGNYKNAISDIERAIELDKNNATYWFFSAIIYIDSEQYEEAIKSSEKAMEIDSTYHAPLLTKGLALAFSGDIKNGIALLRNNLPYLINKVGARILYLCEVILNRSEVESTSLYESALIDYQNEENKSVFSFISGKKKKHNVIYDELHDNTDMDLTSSPETFNPSNIESIDPFIIKKQYQKAYDLLSHLSDSDKCSNEYKITLSYLLINLNKYEQAIEILNNLLENDVNTFWINYHLGLCFQGKNDRELSVLNFEKALGKINPDAVKKRINDVEKTLTC